MSWLKSLACENIPLCDSMWSSAVLLFIIGVAVMIGVVVMILDKQKNRVRRLV